ncbi:mannitol dehydrogenase family protein [Modestobacter sp. I12A-02662]|uniref:mannitol dehydrogenase family protein n=1 Tax=Modestobacter sp. I12A-02662 TaxID=1730496 RepID=UPI0034DE7FBD
MTRLDASTLSSLRGAVDVPSYDRAAVRTGIVHLGVGGFHRAHQAMYLDRLMERGRALDWGICGVGVLRGDRPLADVLTAQDGLYTLVLAHPDGRLDARVVGSLVEYLFAPDDPAAVVARMADPATRIVSMTVTASGYEVPPAVDPAEAVAPATALGLVTAALARRRERGQPPFAVVSCDNMTGNGDIARRSVTGFASALDAGLAAWVDEQVPFPNSMVDRITPATTAAVREEVAGRFGVDDGWPVRCEPWAQWVLEDDFRCGRPPLEEVGVQLVDDVAPYEQMKLRLLNAGHQVLGQLGSLTGLTFAHEACRDELLRAFLADWMEQEARPTVPPVPGTDLARYQVELIARFGNPAVEDTLHRLRADGSVRVPRFLLPVVRDRLAAGRDVRRSALVVAAWTRCVEGRDDAGRPLDLVDPRADALRAAARRQRADPLAFVADRELFGDLADDPRFTRPYLAALDALRSRGARATMQAVLAGSLG